MSANNLESDGPNFQSTIKEYIKPPSTSEMLEQNQNLMVSGKSNNNASEEENNNNNNLNNNYFKKTVTNSIFTVKSNDCLSNTSAQIKSNKDLEVMRSNKDLEVMRSNKDIEEQMKSNAELQIDMKQSAKFNNLNLSLPQPLQELNNVNSCRIEQRPQIAGATKGCELINQFLVYITDAQVENKLHFICREFSNFCTKSCCCDCARSFNLSINYVINNKETDENAYEEPFGLAKKDCACSCFCCNREVLKVQLQEDCNLGKVIDLFTCGSPRFQILDADGNCRYTLNLGCCQCGFLCCNCSDVELSVYAFNDFTKQVGYFTKILACCERVPYENNWIIRFPEAATAEDKFLMIMCVINIDYRYYELNGAYYKKLKNKKAQRKK